MRAARLLLLPALAALGACCTTASTDPRQGGLVGGVCGQATGAYADRLARLENEAAGLDAIERRLSREAERERAVAAREERDLADIRRRITNAQTALAEIERILLRIRVADEASAVTLRRLTADVARLQAELDRLRRAAIDGSNEAELRAVEQEAERARERAKTLERRQDTDSAPNVSDS